MRARARARVCVCVCVRAWTGEYTGVPMEICVVVLDYHNMNVYEGKR